MLMRGFTLVELLVAMALSLLVIVAALGFVLQLLRANGATVVSTRLQQELRSTMALVVVEVRRGGDAELRDGAVALDGRSMNSDAVRIVALHITHDPARNVRRVEVELRGTLRHPPAFLAPRVVTLRQVVALRASGG